MEKDLAFLVLKGFVVFDAVDGFEKGIGHFAM